MSAADTDRMPNRPGWMSPSEPVILGTAMAYPARAAEALGGLEGLESADLASVQHAAVLEAIRDLIGQGIAPEPALVVAALARRHGTRPTADRPWPLVIHDCLKVATVPEGCGPHRRAVLEHRLRVQAHGWGQALCEQSSGPLGPLNGSLNTAVAALARTLARLAEQDTLSENRYRETVSEITAALRPAA